jgi:hypothetical protein
MVPFEENPLFETDPGQCSATTGERNCKIRKSGARRALPLEFDVAVFGDRSSCPFIWDSSAAVCLSPLTRNAAGQKMTTAAAVVHWSLVR